MKANPSNPSILWIGNPLIYQRLEGLEGFDVYAQPECNVARVCARARTHVHNNPSNPSILDIELKKTLKIKGVRPPLPEAHPVQRSVHCPSKWRPSR